MIRRADLGPRRDVGEHRVERGRIGVNVRENRIAHAVLTPARIAIADAGHALANSTVRAIASGTSLRAIRSKPKRGK